MQVERRLTHRLVDYWHLIKGDAVLPAETDVDSDAIADMWDDCFLLRFRPQAEDVEWGYYYEYVGRGLMDVFEDGAPDESGALLMLPAERLMAVYDEMIMTKLPVVEEVEDFALSLGQIKYRMCLLPMGDARGTVTGIFGGMRYKLCDE